ncbi:hypothetical protein BASA60_008687 [Batrachochytrium salamandrivorans]|nr:hypothetical protein BASA60_008687 [Batrachochytrium salamandrivorans]
MRVGIGIILSVLSSSVLAAVIPNYDSHDPRLVRRAGSLANMDVSWSKDNEEEVKFVPSSSGAGTEASAGAEAEASTSGKSRLSGLSGLYSKHKTRWSAAKQVATLKQDEKHLRNAIKKLTKVVTEGENKDQFISKVEIFLRIVLESTRALVKTFDTKVKRPFFLIIPEGKNQKSLKKEMTKIKSDRKKFVEKHITDVNYALIYIISRPRGVMMDLEKLPRSFFRMKRLSTELYDREYTALVSKVGRTGNEENIKATEDYLSDMKSRYDSASVALKLTEREFIGGKITFKEKVPSKLANFKSGVRKRLGLKNKSSTVVPPTPNTSGQDTSDEDESKPKPPGQGPSNQGPPDQGGSKQGPSDEDTSKPKPPGQGPSNQGPPDQGDQNRDHQVSRHQNYSFQDLLQFGFSTVDLCRPYLLYRSIQRVSPPSSFLHTILSLNLSHTDT